MFRFIIQSFWLIFVKQDWQEEKLFNRKTWVKALATIFYLPLCFARHKMDMLLQKKIFLSEKLVN